MVQFNESRSANVTASGTITNHGATVTRYDVEQALRRAARDNGFEITGLTVTVEPGERTVTLTESEYSALQSGASEASTSEA
jgi:hypothetical protein